MNNNPNDGCAVVYHRADFDGVYSGKVCQHFLRKAGLVVDMVPYDYGDPLPPADWPAYQSIYIVDLSVPDLMENPGLRDAVVWIDHHKSAIEKYDAPGKMRFPGLRIDGVAAVRLCWQWFTCEAANHPSDKQPFVDRVLPEPLLIRLLGEYDVWDKRDPRAEALQYGLRALTGDQLALLWDRFVAPVESDALPGSLGRALIDWAVQRGYIVQRYMEEQNGSVIEANGHTIAWRGLRFLACNHARFNSHLFTDGIRPEHDALLGWRYAGPKQRCVVSLYHAPGKEHHDLSLIAVSMGGGGHRGACGFETTIDHMAAILSGVYS